MYGRVTKIIPLAFFFMHLASMGGFYVEKQCRYPPVPPVLRKAVRAETGQAYAPLLLYD